MSPGSPISSRSLLIIGASAVLLAACSSSSGGGGASEEERAAFAGIAALGIAKFGIDMIDDFDDGDVGAFSAVATKNTEQLPCDSGQQSFTDDTGPGPSGGEASPFHSGTFDRVRIEADDCRLSANGFSSRTDGIFEVGEAEGGSVAYFRASDLSGSLDGFFTSESSGFGGGIFSRQRGLMHVCDECSSPQHGSTFELLAFLRSEMRFGDEFDGRFTMGNSVDDRLDMRFTGQMGGQGQSEIYGRLGFEMAGNPCSFDAVYDTISPIVTENSFTENEVVTGGELNIDMVGGGSFNVQIANNTITVNGVTYTEAELEALAARCDFEEEVEF